MNFEELQAKHDDFYSPRFEIALEDATLRESDGVVSSLSVDTTRDGADRFSFTLHYPFDHETGTFSGLDWDRFATGTRVEISMGYGNSLEPLLVGKIRSLAPEFPSGGAPSVEVSGYGLLQDMMRGTKSDSWSDTGVSDIVREVATEYFADVTVDDTGVEPEVLFQDNRNDYRFVEALANKYGFEIIASRDRFEFRARDSRRSVGDPAVTIRYGKSMESFSPEINDAEQVAEVIVRHWDDKKKEEIVGSAESDDDGAGTEVIRTPVASKKEAEQVAEAELERVSESFVTGRAETIGLPEIVAGESVHVGGLGERFSATYYVTSATHRIGGSGYRTTFEVTEKRP